MQVATQTNATLSRPRLLVIRAPEGSGLPNRIIVLSNLPSPARGPIEPARTPAVPSVDTPSTPSSLGNKLFYGHPQSAVRQKLIPEPNNSVSNLSSTSSTSSSGHLTRSLRHLIQENRNNAHGSHIQSPSNIARLSDSIPRAMPPVVPAEKRFGELNIPSVIEAALRRFRDHPRIVGNVRDPSQSFFDIASDTQHVQRSSFGDRMTDLSHMSTGAANLSPDTPMPHGKNSVDNINPRWERRHIEFGTTLGKSDAAAIDSGLSNLPVLSIFDSNMDLERNGVFIPAALGPTSPKGTASNQRTLDDKNLNLNGQTVSQNMDSTFLNHMYQTHSGGLHRDNGSASNIVNTAQIIDLTETRNVFPLVSVNNYPGTNLESNMKNEVASTMPMDTSANALDNKPVMESLNKTAAFPTSTAMSNIISNTTIMNSVNTTTVVVNEGTAVAVDVTATSQSEITNVVSKEQNFSLAQLVDLATTTFNTVQPSSLYLGSIAVKRSSNGESIITLHDRDREPVILKASGPVKIERIVKPNGKIQFIVNTVDIQTTADPGEIEVEAEEITTSPSPVVHVEPTLQWTTHSPIYTESLVTFPTPKSVAVNESSSISVPVIDLGSRKIDSVASSVTETNQQLHSDGLKSNIVFFDPSITSNTNVPDNTKKGLIRLFHFSNTPLPPKIPPPPKMFYVVDGNSGIVPLFSELFSNNLQPVQSELAIPRPSDIISQTEPILPTTISNFVFVKDLGQPKSRLSDLMIRETGLALMHEPKTSKMDIMPQYQLM